MIAMVFTATVKFEFSILCNYYAVPIKAGDGWEISTLKDEGIEPGRINALMRNILNGDIPDVHSVLIIKNSKLVLLF